jgi:quinol monooxygenase YgiN
MNRIARALCAVLLTVAAIPGAFGTRAEAQQTRSYTHIPPDAFSVTAEVRAKPGKEDALRAAALPLIALVRGDPKNLVYFLQEDRAAPGRFVFYEVFASEADFDAHNAMPYVKEFLAELPNLSEGGVQVTKMRVLPQPGR